MAFEFVELDSLRSIEDLAAYQRELRGEIAKVNEDHAGLPFPPEVREEYKKLKDDDGAVEGRIIELEARKRDLERMARNPANVEREEQILGSRDAKGTNRERDIYDLSTIRADWGNLGRAREQFHERAKRAIEIADFPLTRDRRDARVYGFTSDQAKEHVERLLEQDDESGSFSRYLLATGDPSYKRAFVKLLIAQMRNVAAVSLTTEEQRAYERTMAAERALGLGTTGIPIPYQLDPTIIPTSNSVVNPWRAICRTEQIVVNQWRGATSGAITAAYAAEGTEATDNSPTLTQPTVDAVRAQALVPFSIESDQDWAGLQREMASLVADAKDDLESAKFFSGSGTNEPTGLNAMSTGADVATATAATFAIGDTYKLEENVVPRARPRSTIVGNKAILNKIRQFDTQGGAGLWLYFPQGLRNSPSSSGGNGNTGAEGLGYPVYESSQMLNAVTTGNRILLMGDFRYYLIADRVGMSMEVISHIFGPTSRYPIGQRALYAFWRNGGKTLSESQFKFLKVT
jgi:HK97 family phage major capsid protein